MVKDAEKFRKEDKEFTKKLHLRNTLEKYIYELQELSEERNVKESYKEALQVKHAVSMCVYVKVF